MTLTLHKLKLAVACVLMLTVAGEHAHPLERLEGETENPVAATVAR